MKKAIKLAFVFILWMGTAAVEASETSELKVYSIGDKKINVEIQDIQGKVVSYILDENDQVLFERKLKEEDALMATFDVSHLKVGSYHFVVRDKFKQRSVPFEITKQDVFVKMDESVRTNFPQIIQKNDRLLFVQLLADESNDLVIEVKNESGESLFNEKIEGKLGLIGKRFEFTSGRYLIRITSNHFSQTSYFSF